MSDTTEQPAVYPVSVYDPPPPPPVLHPVFARTPEGVWAAEVPLPDRTLYYEIRRDGRRAQLVVRARADARLELRRHTVRTPAQAAAEARKVCRRRALQSDRKARAS